MASDSRAIKDILSQIPADASDSDRAAIKSILLRLDTNPDQIIDRSEAVGADGYVKCDALDTAIAYEALGFLQTALFKAGLTTKGDLPLLKCADKTTREVVAEFDRVLAGSKQKLKKASDRLHEFRNPSSPKLKLLRALASRTGTADEQFKAYINSLNGISQGGHVERLEEAIVKLKAGRYKSSAEAAQWISDYLGEISGALRDLDLLWDVCLYNVDVGIGRLRFTWPGEITEMYGQMKAGNSPIAPDPASSDRAFSGLGMFVGAWTSKTPNIKEIRIPERLKNGREARITVLLEPPSSVPSTPPFKPLPPQPEVTYLTKNGKNGGTKTETGRGKGPAADAGYAGDAYFNSESVRKRREILRKKLAPPPVKTPPKAHVRPIRDIVRESNRALHSWERGEKPVLDVPRFYIDWQVRALKSVTESQYQRYRELWGKLDKKYDALETRLLDDDSLSPEQRLGKFMEIVEKDFGLSGDEERYFDAYPFFVDCLRLSDADPQAAKVGCNCNGRAEAAFATLHGREKLFPKGFELAAQYKPEHVQFVLYSRTRHEVWELGRTIAKTNKIDGPIYDKMVFINNFGRSEIARSAAPAVRPYVIADEKFVIASDETPASERNLAQREKRPPLRMIVPHPAVAALGQSSSMNPIMAAGGIRPAAGAISPQDAATAVTDQHDGFLPGEREYYTAVEALKDLPESCGEDDVACQVMRDDISYRERHHIESDPAIVYEETLFLRDNRTIEDYRRRTTLSEKVNFVVGKAEADLLALTESPHFRRYIEILRDPFGQAELSDVQPDEVTLASRAVGRVVKTLFKMMTLDDILLLSPNPEDPEAVSHRQFHDYVLERFPRIAELEGARRALPEYFARNSADIIAYINTLPPQTRGRLYRLLGRSRSDPFSNFAGIRRVRGIPIPSGMLKALMKELKPLLADPAKTPVGQPALTPKPARPSGTVTAISQRGATPSPARTPDHRPTQSGFHPVVLVELLLLAIEATRDDALLARFTPQLMDAIRGRTSRDIDSLLLLSPALSAFERLNVMSGAKPAHRLTIERYGEPIQHMDPFGNVTDALHFTLPEHIALLYYDIARKTNEYKNSTIPWQREYYNFFSVYKITRVQ